MEYINRLSTGVAEAEFRRRTRELRLPQFQPSIGCLFRNLFSECIYKSLVILHVVFIRLYKYNPLLACFMFIFQTGTKFFSGLDTRKVARVFFETTRTKNKNKRKVRTTTTNKQTKQTKQKKKRACFFTTHQVEPRSNIVLPMTMTNTSSSVELVLLIKA